MVWSQLTDHLEVLWGALVALVIVLVLTPAVGRVARYLRLVDRPLEGERARPGDPAARRAGALPRRSSCRRSRSCRSAARCAAILLGAAVATTVGAIDDFRGLRVVAEARRAGRSQPRSRPGSGCGCTRFTFPVVGMHQLPPWVGVPLTVIGIVAVMNMVNFLDGLDGLAAGVCAISGFDVLP